MRKLTSLLIVFLVVLAFSQTTNDELSKKLLELEKRISVVDSNYMSIFQKVSELRKLIEQVPTYAEFNKLAQDVNNLKSRQENLEKSYQSLLKEVENLKKELQKANEEIAKLKGTSVKSTTDNRTNNLGKANDGIFGDILSSENAIYIPIILFLITLMVSFL